MGSCLIAARSLASEIQSFLFVNAVHTLMIVLKTFPAQQNVNAPKAIAHPGNRNLFNTLPEGPVFSTVMFVIPYGAVQPDHPASPLYRNPVGVDKISGQEA